MSEITKEELLAFTDAHAKSAIALEAIANRLTDLTAKQDKMIDKITNGLANHIIDGVTANYNQTHKETIKALETLNAKCEILPTKLIEKVNNSTMAKNIERAAWFIGIVGLAIIVATVVLRGLDDRSITNTLMKNMNQQIEQLEGDVTK